MQQDISKLQGRECIRIRPVEFPTWTTVNDQDDITWGRGTGTKNPDGTYTYTYRVNTSEHGNADGEIEHTYICI